MDYIVFETCFKTHIRGVGENSQSNENFENWPKLSNQI